MQLIAGQAVTPLIPVVWNRHCGGCARSIPGCVFHSIDERIYPPAADWQEMDRIKRIPGFAAHSFAMLQDAVNHRESR